MCPCLRLPASAASVVGAAHAFPAAPQFGAEQPGHRIEQAARQVVQVGAGVLQGVGVLSGARAGRGRGGRTGGPRRPITGRHGRGRSARGHSGATRRRLATLDRWRRPAGSAATCRRRGAVCPGTRPGPHHGNGPLRDRGGRREARRRRSLRGGHRASVRYGGGRYGRGGSDDGGGRSGRGGRGGGGAVGGRGARRDVPGRGPAGRCGPDHRGGLDGAQGTLAGARGGLDGVQGAALPYARNDRSGAYGRGPLDPWRRRDGGGRVRDRRRGAPGGLPGGGRATGPAHRHHGTAAGSRDGRRRRPVRRTGVEGEGTRGEQRERAGYRLSGARCTAGRAARGGHAGAAVATGAGGHRSGDDNRCGGGGFWWPPPAGSRSGGRGAGSLGAPRRAGRVRVVCVRRGWGRCDQRWGGCARGPMTDGVA